MRDEEIEDLLETIDNLMDKLDSVEHKYDYLIEEVKGHLDEPTKETAAKLEKIISEYENKLCLE